MSQSPVHDFSAESTLRYQQGWRTLNRLLHEDRSFSGHERHCLFLNCGLDAGGRLEPFANVSSATGFDLPDDGRALAVVDWDFDGDLDLWTANRTAPRVRLLRNMGTSRNHFLVAKLEGNGQSVNRDAIGARIEVHFADSTVRPLIRTVRAGESFVSQSSSWVHFGLGRQDAVERLIVRWPGGEVEELEIPQVDRFYLIRQGAGQVTAWIPPARKTPLPAVLVDALPTSEQARIVLPRGLPLPEIRMLDEAGSVQTWQRDARRPLLINLWASWCSPCLVELSEWSQRAGELRSANLEVVALNTDALDASQSGTSAAAEPTPSVKFPFVSIPAARATVQALNAVQQGALDRWKPLPVPSSFLVDAHGEIVVIYKGPVGVDQLLADCRLLDASPEARRSAGTPFDGKWVDELAPYATARRVANQLLDQNEVDEALGYLHRIVEITGHPLDEARRRELGDTWYFVGVLYDFRQQLQEARHALMQARELLPNDVRVRGDLGKLFARAGEFTEAARELSAAVRINPQDLELKQHLGLVLLQLNDLEAASQVLADVVEQDPRNATAWYLLANARLAQGEHAEAIQAYRAAVRHGPRLLEAANNLAWIQSVHPDDRLRQGREALDLAQRLCELTQFKEYRFLDTLAAAHAELGQFDQAVQVTQKAIRLCQAAAGPGTPSDADAVQAMRQRLQNYQQHQPYRESSWSAADRDVGAGP